MPYFFTPSDPSYVIYMGIDQHENEYLARHGWPEDIFFHVDDLSSAHIYLRCPKIIDLKDFKKIKEIDDFEKVYGIPSILIHECLQLTKANSIQGCKEKEVSIICSPWQNLLKTQDMEVGSISFKNSKIVPVFHKITENKQIKKQLIKTKKKEIVNEKWFIESKERRNQKEKLGKLAEKRAAKKAAKKAKELEKEKRRKEKQEKEERSYDRLFDDSLMKSNKDMNMTAEEYENSFM